MVVEKTEQKKEEEKVENAKENAKENQEEERIRAQRNINLYNYFSYFYQ